MKANRNFGRASFFILVRRLPFVKFRAHALNTCGLSELQIAHIQTIINDIVEVKAANA